MGLFWFVGPEEPSTIEFAANVKKFSRSGKVSDSFVYEFNDNKEDNKTDLLSIYTDQVRIYV